MDFLWKLSETLASQKVGVHFPDLPGSFLFMLHVVVSAPVGQGTVPLSPLTGLAVVAVRQSARTGLLDPSQSE
jgi:hypothetical protein